LRNAEGHRTHSRHQSLEFLEFLISDRQPMTLETTAQASPTSGNARRRATVTRILEKLRPRVCYRFPHGSRQR